MKTTNDKRPTQKEVNESMVKANRYLVKQEKQDIENYIRRHQWEMIETGSGLHYEITEKGRGVQAKTGDIAVLDFSCSLLSGDMVYNSKKEGQKVFRIGKGGVESGLEEMLLLMHQGDKARLILPSHLAFGLVGDDNKIPKRAVLVYTIELIELK